MQFAQSLCQFYAAFWYYSIVIYSDIIYLVFFAWLTVGFLRPIPISIFWVKKCAINISAYIFLYKHRTYSNIFDSNPLNEITELWPNINVFLLICWHTNTNVSAPLLVRLHCLYTKNIYFWLILCKVPIILIDWWMDSSIAADWLGQNAPKQKTVNMNVTNKWLGEIKCQNCLIIKSTLCTFKAENFTENVKILCQ